MFSLFFDLDRAENYEQVANSNIERFNQFFHKMLDQGIYLAPSAFEAGFISAEHNDDIIETTLAAAEIAFAELATK
jgi:glutamate-1-semialdehyde 2,1-aminomutase